jgi:hypothetical protein
VTVKPDPILAKDQLQALQAQLKAWGPAFFMAAMFWILPKQKEELIEQGVQAALVPFRLNRLQNKIEEKLARNNLLVKDRQGGGTTYFSLRRLLLPAITDYGVGCQLISQSSLKAQEHFEIVRRAYRLIGCEDPYDQTVNDFNKSLKENLLHTVYSNRRELVFDMLESRLTVESAEVEESSQGITLHHLVCSEYSRWPGKPAETLSNARGALVPTGTTDKECTANGMQGPFWEDVKRALFNPKESDARLHFYPWVYSDDYELDLSPEKAKKLEDELTKEEHLLIKKFQKELSDVTWHRWIQKIAFRREKKIEQRANFDEKYPEDVITAFLVAGNQYFDRNIVIARKLELANFKPYKTLRSGEAQILHPRIPGRRYILALDCATGRAVNDEDTDNAAAVVIDVETGEEVGAYCAHVPPEQAAYDVDELGRYFNNALIAVERTGDGGTAILTLSGECKYPSMYKHKEWWKRERKVVEVDGFPTTRKTRPIALNFICRFIMEHPELVWDEKFLDECLVFVRDEKGIPAGASGAHDDRVSARWIAHYVRMVLLGYWRPFEQKSEKYQSADEMTDVEEVEV